MCGIAGCFGTDPGPYRIARALEALRERGPDARGSLQRQLGNGLVTLLSTRLSIIDLDPRSDQPMSAGDLSISYNGEVYNYRELRSQLEVDGTGFRTGSDTEVVLEAYRRWGPACTHRLEGMWAFAILDERRQSLFISRDRFGKKPLLWMTVTGTFYFASDVRTLLTLANTKPAVNDKHIQRFLVNGYKSLHKTDETFLNGVSHLPPGNNVSLERPDEPTISRYWNLSYEPREMSLEEAEDESEQLIADSITLRLRADVPKAMCLSGGVDSSVIAAMSSAQGDPLECFTVVDRDERYDESTNVRQTVAHLGLTSTEIDSSGTKFIDTLTDLVGYHMKPVATLSSLMQSLLFERIAAAGYKVALSGTGADELFTGYYDHYLFWLAEMASTEENITPLIQDWKNSYGAYVRNPFLQDPLAFSKDPSSRQHIYLDRTRLSTFLLDPDVEDFTEQELSKNLLRNRMLNELRHEAVPVLLEEEDLNSMRHSVESRPPYLDASLARFMFTVPTPHLIRKGWPKWLLRQAGLDLLPKDVVLDRRKRGFNVPITSLVDLKEPVVRAWLLEAGPLFDIVDRKRLEEFIASPITKNSESKFLFSCISTKLYLEKYVLFTP